VRTLLVSCLLLVGAAGAQSRTFVLPKDAEKDRNSFHDMSNLGLSASSVPFHVQNGYDTAEMPVATARVMQLAYRRNQYYSNSIATSTSTMTIYMSHGPNAPASFSSTFASNEGNDRTMVFSGTVNWPASPFTGRNTPFEFKVPLKQTFVLIQTKGKSIVVDTTVTARTHLINASENGLILDAQAEIKSGVRTTNETAHCNFSNGNRNNGLGATTSGLTEKGGVWQVIYGNLPPNALGVMTVSAFGKPAWGNIRLPIDLTPIGAPQCTWAVGLESGVWLPFKVSSGGQGTVGKVPVPAGITAGTSFYDGAFVVDAKANAAGIVPLWSSKWTFRQTTVVNAVTVTRSKDSTPPSPTGSLRRGQAALIEFTY